LSGQGAFGQHLAERFGFNSAPAFVTRKLRETEIAVTEISCAIENNGMTSPIPVEDALLVTVQLKDCAAHDLWLDGTPQPTAYLKAGTACIYDLRTTPVVNSISPFNNVHFYLPRRTLAAIAEGDGIPCFDEIGHRPGIGIQDGVLSGLAMSLKPAFMRPEETNRIFVDHVSVALAAHVAHAFAPQHAERTKTPNLGAASARRAQEMLDEDRDGTLSMRELAEEVGMPVGRFQRGFTQRTGVPPHRWLLGRRVDRALDLMRTTSFPLDEIATASGFNGVKHLDRVLLRLVGSTASIIRAEVSRKQKPGK
jgi:AraC-like DNA-binding protein